MHVPRAPSDFTTAQDNFNSAQSSFQTASTVISVGAIVGIVITVVTLIVIGVGIACILHKRSKRRAAMMQPIYATGYTNTTYGPPPTGAPGQVYPSYPPQNYQTYDQTQPKDQSFESELAGSHVPPKHELDGSHDQPRIHELPIHDPKQSPATSV